MTTITDDVARRVLEACGTDPGPSVAIMCRALNATFGPDEAMVQRALAAFWKHPDAPYGGQCFHAAITAALTPEPEKPDRHWHRRTGDPK